MLEVRIMTSKIRASNGEAYIVMSRIQIIFFLLYAIPPLFMAYQFHMVMSGALDQFYKQNFMLEPLLLKLLAEELNEILLEKRLTTC